MTRPFPSRMPFSFRRILPVHSHLLFDIELPQCMPFDFESSARQRVMSIKMNPFSVDRYLCMKYCTRIREANPFHPTRYLQKQYKFGVRQLDVLYRTHNLPVELARPKCSSLEMRANASYPLGHGMIFILPVVVGGLLLLF